ncbi:hypothetical protein J2X06_003146 [Lysobacter niastensis]|uniref:Uncharacterized protein n=1 Tax=Lysobacter niastensis TaxID=380629 RepID=A0ABU1WE82_9GAMM|nr:hypothetical protein [Lysobacter niastensis]
MVLLMGTWAVAKGSKRRGLTLASPDRRSVHPQPINAEDAAQPLRVNFP